jgi:hypothetical protein
MNKYTVYILLTISSGFSLSIANATSTSSQAKNPVVERGPGPVINPENSQYIEEKKSEEKTHLKRKGHNKNHYTKMRHNYK